jgi:hypothetical protein
VKVILVYSLSRLRNCLRNCLDSFSFSSLRSEKGFLFLFLFLISSHKREWIPMFTRVRLSFAHRYWLYYAAAARRRARRSFL